MANKPFAVQDSIKFPDGTVQATADTGSGGSSGDPRVWVETFASDAPTTDFVQGATSVEYDADGNVIALFSHYEPDPDSSYTSVAKLTPAGAVLWQVRFGANLNTDGWGLAYDTVDNIVYVAGRTSGTPLTYEFATLTKLNGTFGNIIWSKNYDFEADSTSAVVDVDSDGNPVMVGYSYNGTDNYITTSKINKTDGSVLWSKTLDGQGDDQAYGMAIGPSNEIVTIGYVDTFGLQNAAATLYTEPASNPNWTSGVGGPVGGVNFSVTFTDGVPTFTNVSDTVGNRTVDDVLGVIGGNAFGGASPADDMTVKVATLAANDTDDRMVVVKYDSTGTIQWQKAIQFDAGYNCSGADADIDSAGNIYVCGQYQYDFNGGTTSAMSLVKFNSSGVKQWSRRVVGNCDTFGTSVVVGDDDQVYLSGITANNNASDYIWVVAKYNTDGVVTWQRLIDNTTTWSFGGSFWFGGGGGGSNIAVKNGYVALAGTFGDPGTQPIAVVVQIDTDATPFSVGDWDIKGASFSGLLNGTASDITVVDANKPVATASPTVGTFASGEDTSNFLTITRYGLAGGDSSLVNGAYTVTLGNTGTVTLPAGGTITEGYVTSNPTIQLTPANPDVASQKLVIKGGGAYTYIDNGIEINYNNNTAIVGDTLTFYVYSNTYADQTLYWWIYPQGAGIGDTESDTVVMEGSSGMFSILIDSDDYEFTVRVSPEADNYDPANVGVETGLINPDSPTFDADHHLHLTTGNLAETSIFLGTDNHNVRTNTDGSIQITSTTYGAVDSIDSSTSQGGYNTGTYTGLTTTGGSGTGLTVNATSTGGYIDFVTIVNPGTGYTNGDVLTLVGGDGLGCTLNIIVLGISEWKFNTDGTTIFPTLTVERGDDPSNTITGQTLLFSDSTQEAIISTPNGTVANNSSQRLVLNPGKGYNGGEGGDIYLWAGRGGNASGTGGDIKIRGGQGGANTGGGSGGDGGYIRIEAGDAASTGGAAGYVDIHGGLSTTSGGAVNIRTATTNTFNHAWQFGNNGTLTLPKASKVSEVTPATGPAPSIYPTLGESSIANEAFVTVPPPAVNNYTIPGTDIVINMTFGANGPSFYGPTATIVNGGTGHTTNESLMIPYADMGITYGGNWEWFVNTIASNLVLEAGSKDWTFAADGVLTVPGSIIPDTNVAYDLGSPTAKFRSLYLSTSTIYIGTSTISISQTGQMLVNGNDAVSKLEYFGGEGNGPRDAGSIDWTTSTITFNIPGKELLTAIYDLKPGNKIRAANTLGFDQEFTIAGNAREYIRNPGGYQMAEIAVAETTSTTRYAFSLYLPVKDKSATLSNGTWTLAVSTTGTVVFPNGTQQTGASISIVALKTLVAASTDFADFKSRIAAL